jgi:hypothetical protein
MEVVIDPPKHLGQTGASGKGDKNIYRKLV